MSRNPTGAETIMSAKQFSLLTGDSQPLSPVQRRLLDAASDIAMSEPEELAFQHSVCCQCALPTTKPPEGVSIWEKRQGRAYLMVEAGKVIDPKTGRYIEPDCPTGRRPGCS